MSWAASTGVKCFSLAHSPWLCTTSTLLPAHKETSRGGSCYPCRHRERWESTGKRRHGQHTFPRVLPYWFPRAITNNNWQRQNIPLPGWLCHFIVVSHLPTAPAVVGRTCLRVWEPKEFGQVSETLVFLAPESLCIPRWHICNPGTLPLWFFRDICEQNCLTNTMVVNDIRYNSPKHRFRWEALSHDCNLAVSSPSWKNHIHQAVRGQNAMQKWGSQGQDFLLYKTHTGCMPEQISALQSPSTLRSTQHAGPCHMQLLIHLDTAENNGPGEEEQRSWQKLWMQMLAMSKPLWHPSCQGPQTGPNYPSLWEWPLLKTVHVAMDAYLAHRQVEQDD